MNTREYSNKLRKFCFAAEQAAGRKNPNLNLVIRVAVIEDLLGNVDGSLHGEIHDLVSLVAESLNRD